MFGSGTDVAILIGGILIGVIVVFAVSYVVRAVAKRRRAAQRTTSEDGKPNRVDGPRN